MEAHRRSARKLHISRMLKLFRKLRIWFRLESFRSRCLATADQLGQPIGIISPADPKPVSACKLELKQTVGHNGPGLFETGMVNYLHWQEARRVHKSLRRSRRMARVTQPFEDQVGIQRKTPRHLRHRHFGSRRLKTDRPLHFVRPKPLRSPSYPKPHSVHYPKRTLPNPLYPRQSSRTGRLR